MQAGSSHRGEMSQDSIMNPLHRKDVSIDPAARATKRAFNVISMSSVGLELGLSVVVGALFGRWLDSKAGTSPWLLLLFLVLGFVAGLRSLLRASKKLDRAPEDHG